MSGANNSAARPRWRRFARTVSRVVLVGTFLGLILVTVLLWKSWNLAKLNQHEPTLILLDRHGEFLAQVRPKSLPKERGYGYWPVPDIPERVATALIALEDKDFWEHQGVDVGAAFRALWQNVSSGRRVSGASTLAMQVARMQNPGSRTYWRKGVEATTAFLLTQRYSREDILRQYLKLVPYGNQSHGIAHAARYYLDKPVQDLSWAEIAILSAIPQAPSIMNPFKLRGQIRIRKRAKFVLKLLREQQVITEAEHELAEFQVETTQFSHYQKRPKEALHAIFKLRDELRWADLKEQYVEPRIHTTLDLKTQALTTQLSKQFLRTFKRWGAGNIAITVTHPTTHEVIAWSGSTDYFNQQHDGSVDYIRAPRALGSTLKPFIYGYAMDQGTITPATVLEDLHTTAAGIVNYDKVFLGPVLPRQALANSRNVVAVELLRAVGLESGYEMFRDLGIHDDPRPARYYGLGMALGSIPSSLESLTEAYTAITNDGRVHPLRWHKHQPDRPSAPVLDQATAQLLTLFLSDPAARLPSFPRMGTTEFPFPVALKTGTSQGYRDAWTMAWSQKYLVGVWIGRPDGGPMNKLSGAGSAAAIAQQVMKKLHKDELAGLSDLDFPQPDGYVARKICSVNGRLAGGDCPRSYTEWFAPDSVPVDMDISRMIAFDKRTGKIADSNTPAEWIEVRQIRNTSPQMYEWLKMQEREQIELKISQPIDGQYLLIHPEMPPEHNTIAMRVKTTKPVKQVLWYVDGEPYATATDPFSVRWQLKPGQHTFQVGLPYRQERSQPVTITVY